MLCDLGLIEKLEVNMPANGNGVVYAMYGDLVYVQSIYLLCGFQRIVRAMTSSSVMVSTYSGAAQKSVRITESEDGVFLALSLISIANTFSR